jgi:hypothetical protein
MKSVLNIHGASALLSHVLRIAPGISYSKPIESDDAILDKMNKHRKITQSVGTSFNF